MATDLKQLLNGAEVKRKLWNTGSYTSNKIPDYEELVDIWEDYVYIRNASTFNGNNSKKVPNNGQIWPKKTLKFHSNNLYSASISNTERTIYFYEPSWDSNYAFSPQENSTYVYTNDSNVAGAGYYMEERSGNSYKYYQVNSSGKIIEIGLYQRGYLYISEEMLELDNSDSDTSTISTNIPSVAVLSIDKYPAVYDGSFPSAVSGGLPTTILRGSVSGGVFTATSGSNYINYAYPIVIFTIGGTKDGELTSAEILVHPVWYIDTSNVSAENLSSLGTTINPLNSIHCNVPVNSIDYQSKPYWVTVSGRSLVVAQNTSTSPRSGTVVVRGFVNGVYGEDEKRVKSGNITNSFTISQKGANIKLWIIIRKSNPTVAYLSKSQQYITNSYLVSAPASITIDGIYVEDANSNGSSGEGTIQNGNNSGRITWLATPLFNGTIDTVVNAGQAYWTNLSNPPEGYDLQNVIWIN